MSQQIQLSIEGDKLKVVSPYHQKFVSKARNLRGSWKNNAWYFDDSLIDYVRDLMLACWGTTGEQPYENCTLVVKNFSDTCSAGPVELFGRTIARASGRDSGAKLGDHIFLIEGKCGSGGSVKNWSTYVSDATFEIQNYPSPRAEFDDITKAVEEGWVQIKRVKKARSREEIETEIFALQGRIKELETELNSL